jgi:hypothetical protein
VENVIILTQKYQKKSYNPGGEEPEPLIPAGSVFTVFSKKVNPAKTEEGNYCILFKN